MADCRRGRSGRGESCRSGEAIGPFPQQRLDETPDLTTGSWRVRSNAHVADVHRCTESSERARHECRTVVGHDAFHMHVLLGEPADCPLQKGAGRAATLVSQDVNVTESSEVIGGRIDELKALLFRSEGTAAGDAMSHTIEAAQALDIEVEQLAGSLPYRTGTAGGSTCRKRLSPADRQIRATVD